MKAARTWAKWWLIIYAYSASQSIYTSHPRPRHSYLLQALLSSNKCGPTKKDCNVLIAMPTRCASQLRVEKVPEWLNQLEVWLFRASEYQRCCSIAFNSGNRIFKRFSDWERLRAIAYLSVVSRKNPSLSQYYSRSYLPSRRGLRYCVACNGLRGYEACCRRYYGDDYRGRDPWSHGPCGSDRSGPCNSDDGGDTVGGSPRC